ncbi:hypothetical protein EU527_09520 [Candidatus Thorarchaeota archaeon]|nr:MAG: hypothetical protein EU527_09520 [Candidatus Thorarchaeota archaeon]
MKKIDEVFPDIGMIPALIITIVIAAVLQLGGSWIAMFVAGAMGALFVKRHRKAFFVGFVGVFIGWLLLFSYLILTAQALTIADFFLSQLGLSGLGWLVVVISCLIGGLLGGFGALLGRSIVELLDGIIEHQGESNVQE